MDRRSSIFVAVLISIFGFVIFNSNAYAADSSTILNKWNYTQYYNCAKSYFVKSPYWNGTNETVLDEVVGKKGVLAMPSQGFQGASGPIDCKTLMTGPVGIQDVSRLNGDAGTVNALFNSLGYKAKDAVGATATINYTYTKEGTIDAGSVPSTLNVTINANGPVNSDDGNLRVSRIDADSFKICLGVGNVCTGRISARTDNVAALNNDIVRALRETSLVRDYGEGVKYSAGNFSVTTDSEPAGYVYPPSGKSASETAAETTKNFSGMGLSDLRLSDSELYTLYMSYLKNNASTIACGNSAGGGYAVKLKTTDGTFKQCKVEFGDKNPSSISVNTQKYNVYPYISSINMLGVLSWFNGANEAALTDIEDSLVPADGTIVPEETQEQQGEASEAGDVDCQSSGAGKSLGWILCPVLNVLSEAADGAYDLVEDNLKVDKRLFDWNNEDNGIKDAWTQFQAISNLLFVIFLLVILFSQITGFGLDNYGIKKMLPKLIIAAVLVNLSYYICAICVDVSNIAGVSLREMFEGFRTGTTASQIVTDGGTLNLGDYTATGHLVSVGLLGALAGGIFMVVANPMILISLLISALGVVVSIFFLFIMLSLRQAAIVVLIVISPLAFALYLMPNSKGYFDKYIKLFGSLLLLFPLCGLLIGGGNYVSRLLMTSGFGDQGLVPAFTAVIVGVAPIFFVPMLLKKSLDAIGGLGGKLSGIGKAAGSGVERGIRNSNAYKSAQESSLMRRARIMGGLDKNGNPHGEGLRRTLANVAAGGSKNRQRNALQYQKMVREQGSLKAADEEDFMLKTATDNEMTRIVASGEINNIGTLEKNLGEALKSGNRASIRAYTDALSTKGEDGRNAVKKAWNSNIGKMANGSAKTFGDNIMNNHAVAYKRDARSMFEVAKEAQNGREESSETVAGSSQLALSASASTMVSMDDSEFAQTFGADGNGNWKADLDEDEIRAVRHAAYTAIKNDPNNKNKRFAALSNIMKGYNPDSPNTMNTTNYPNGIGA